jgi:L-ascorbate metabolism protein UlaG (beta-lactamase superfamily)
MLHRFGIAFLLLATTTAAVFGQTPAAPKADEFAYDGNKLKITFLGHASLVLDWNGTVVYVDPVTQYGPFSGLPKADLVLVTHEHGDHFDPGAIAAVSKEGTLFIANPAVIGQLKKGTALANGQSWEGLGMKIDAVPAYNTTPGRTGFHPKGRDNGYVLTLGKKRVYIAGDTEDIPEMAALKNIDIAFLPMDQPYTMTPAQGVKAALMFKPKILYPYHLGDTNLNAIKDAFKDVKGIELRIRDLQ